MRVLVIAVGLMAPIIVLDGLKAAFLDGLPFKDPESLVVISGVAQSRGRDYVEILDGRPAIESVTHLRYGKATWSRPDGGSRVNVVLIDDRALDLLGLAVPRGRGFTRDDRIQPQAALVSRAFLETALFDDTRALGQALTINGVRYTVIGEAPQALERLGAFDVVLPRALARSARFGKSDTFFSDVVIGRARTGVPLAEVQKDMERLQRSNEAPGRAPSMVGVWSLADRLSGPSRPALQALSFAAMVLVLLSAVTVGMLAATLSSERLPEFAVRQALGASSARLRLDAMRPWLSALVPATILSLAVISPLSRWLWSTLPSLGAIHVMSAGTVLATLLLGLLLTVSAAAGTLIPQQLLLPALAGVSGTLPADRRGARIGRTLATIQVALSVALMCGAAIAGKALHDQSARDLGFTAEGLFQIEVVFGEGETNEALATAWRSLHDVVSATGATHASNPPWTSAWSWWAGSASNPAGGLATITAAGPGFLSTLGVRSLEGGDPFAGGAPKDAVVVGASFAKRLNVRTGSIIKLNNSEARVAGIVSDLLDPTLKPMATKAQIYVVPGFESRFESAVTVFIRGSMAEALRERSLLEGTLPNAHVGQPMALAGALASRLERERLGAIMLASYAALASLLVVVGLEGLMRRRVAQRMKEVGIRKALGATTRQIDETVLRPIVLPAMAGIAIGLGLGFELAASIALLMSWARPLDSPLYVLSAMAAGVLVIASAWPALRRASAAHPADLLRHL